MVAVAGKWRRGVVTDGDRIAHLEAALAEKDRTISVMSEALRAANLRLQQEGEASKALADRREAARLKKQRQRALRGVSQDSGADVSRGQSRDNGGTPLPPPLGGSPPPSVPSSPSPISSPPSLFPSLASQAAPPARKAKKAKEGPPPDPRHAPLVKALVETCGYPFRGGRDAKAVTDLLALADQQDVTRGDLAGTEVVRRARIGWAWVGFPTCRSLSELATHWGHYESEQRSQAPPRSDDGIARGRGGMCAACESEGDGASVGEPPVWLGYGCGCMGDWTRDGLHYTKAQEWARRRRDGTT